MDFSIVWLKLHSAPYTHYKFERLEKRKPAVSKQLEPLTGKKTKMNSFLANFVQDKMMFFIDVLAALDSESEGILRPWRLLRRWWSLVL